MKREDIVALDKRHVWHPYTAMAEYIESESPLVIERAQGSRLIDVDGREYLDGNASWWTAVLGHGHPRLVAKLREQSERLCHTALAGMTHGPIAELSAELSAVVPAQLPHYFFSDDGSTAVEVAMKLALQYFAQNGAPERTRFIALDGAFHGETLGVSALGGVEVFRRPFASVLLDCVHASSASDGYERAFSAIERIARDAGERVAAIVLEPMVQGAAGMRTYDAEYLRQMRGLSDEIGALLVFDEVFSGYGRTGPMWAHQHAGVVPDMLCTAKGFSGGMFPMAATFASRSIFDGFLGAPERAFFYGHIFTGNPLGAAVAAEVLRVFRDEQVLAHAANKAARIAQAFEAMAALPGVRGVRSLGMIGALDLEGEGGYLQRSGWRVYEAALARGAYLRPLGNVVYVAPALNIPDSDLDELLGIVRESVTAAVS
jgi:adenosylmethionine-8-amino-7-oxononanoate aminotransferase